MRRTRALAAAGLWIIIGGCAASGADDRPAAATYVVRPHDTLYSIAWRHNLDYRDLAKWNHIGADYRLSIGQVLLLRPAGGAPPVRARAAARSPLAAGANAYPAGSSPGPPAAPPPPTLAPPQGQNAAPGHDQPRVGKPVPLGDSSAAPATAAADALRDGEPGGAPAPSARAAPNAGVAPNASAAPSTGDWPGAGAQPGAAGGASKWVWPTDARTAPRPVPGGGILLLGRLGQDVRAAGSGRVVYTGSGLRGYGNLVIIKHGDSLLSSYAHNRELLVHEGQKVAAGQVIAHMGMGPHQVSALYFEIRINGKPTDPLRYLAAAH